MKKTGGAVHRRPAADHGNQAPGRGLSVDPRRQVHRSTSRTTTATRISTFTPWIRLRPRRRGADAPPSRDLTGLKGVRVQLYSAPKNDPDVLYIGLNDRDKAWHDLYKLKISTGERTLIRKNTERISGWVFDLGGQAAAGRRAWRITATRKFCAWTPNGFTKIYSCSVFENLRRRCASTKTASGSTWRPTRATTWTCSALALFDPATGKVEDGGIRSAEARRLRSALFSEATDELVATTYQDERDRRYFKDKAFEADYRWLEAKLPGKEIGVSSRTRRRADVAGDCARRHRAGRNLSVRPQDAPAHWSAVSRCAKNCRAKRWRRCSRSATSLPTAWRFPLI